MRCVTAHTADLRLGKKAGVAVIWIAPLTRESDMTITEGSYYIARNGELVGPMERSGAGNARMGSPWYVNRVGLYRTDGTFGYGDDCVSPVRDITDTVDNAARKHVEGN